MAKTKTPFFGLGSQGTVGKVLTSQKRGLVTMLRSKPIPTDPYSLPQAYQRWLYQDYAHLWTQQSEATRRENAAAGSRFHLTGFQYWMRTQLNALADLVGYWKLDEALGVVSRDSSPNAYNGVIFGATPIAGMIDGAYYFDGLNDHIDYPSLGSPSDWTIEFFFNCPTVTGNWNILDMNYGTLNDNTGPRFELHAVGDLHCVVADDAGVWSAFIVAAVVTPDIDHHIAVVKEGNNILCSFDGVETINQAYANWPSAFQNPNLGVGWRLISPRWYKGIIDQFVVLNRPLSQTVITRHSERRYPS